MKKQFSYLMMTVILIVIPSFVYGSDYQSIDDILHLYSKEIITLRDLDADSKEDFASYELGQNPGVVRADFNGDGIEDVAILTKSALKFFLCSKRCKDVKTISYGGFFNIQYIVAVEKGRLIEETNSISTTSQQMKVRLKYSAVRLVDSGKASVVYFWDQKKRDITSIATGD